MTELSESVTIETSEAGGALPRLEERPRSAPRPPLPPTDGPDAVITFADQFGALPYRVRDGVTEVMLVTSRISRHWLIPKGWPIAGKNPTRSAQQEAFEEAGVRGKSSSAPIGGYQYVKVLKDGSSIPCTVTVFALRVRKELADWPEREQRDRQWFAVADAARIVTEPGLAAFLLALGDAPLEVSRT